MSVLNEVPSIDFSLIWGSLRNLVDFKIVEIPNEIALVGTTVGEFPVNSFQPIFLEIAKDGKKMDLSGRLGFISAKSNIRITWRSLRIVSLPFYETTKESLNFTCLKPLLKSWQNSFIPEDVPCIALAVNTTGSYCDIREGQRVAVLLIWNDNTARILTLDWFEGPLEDCISPEWYISSSEWLPLERAFEKLENICTCPSSLQNPIYSLFINPPCLGCEFKGDKNEIIGKCWQFEWIYRNQLDLVKDLKSTLRRINKLLSF